VIDEQILFPSGWRTALGLARAALAVGCVYIEVVYSQPGSPLARVLLVGFLGYAILLLVWNGVRRSGYALLSLILDTIFFLIAATIEAEPVTWLCAAMFLYLMSSAVLFHRWKHVLIASVTAAGICLLIRQEDFGLLAPALSGMTLLALFASRQKEMLLERLIAASRQAVEFRTESEKAREAERERIAADFHDGPLQSFISIQMRLEILRRMLERDPDTAAAELVQLQDLTKSQVGEIRAFVRSMRPVEVDGAGLTAAISRLVDSFQKDTGISATFLGNVTYETENSDVAHELVKIVREALHNAQKHAAASRVAVGMERTNGALEILIQDDGSGFSFAGTYSLEEMDLLRLGPESIKRRVRALDGDLVVESRPGVGAGLKIRIPI